MTIGFINALFQPLGDLNVETCVVDELKERDSSARVSKLMYVLSH